MYIHTAHKQNQNVPRTQIHMHIQREGTLRYRVSIRWHAYHPSCLAQRTDDLSRHDPIMSWFPWVAGFLLNLKLSQRNTQRKKNGIWEHLTKLDTENSFASNVDAKKANRQAQFCVCRPVGPPCQGWLCRACMYDAFLLLRFPFNKVYTRTCAYAKYLFFWMTLLNDTETLH